MSWPIGQFFTRIEEAADLTSAANTELAWFGAPDRWRLHTVWCVVKTAVACDVTPIVLDVNWRDTVGTEFTLGRITITNGAAVGDVFEMAWLPIATLNAYSATTADGKEVGIDHDFIPTELLIVQVHTQGVDTTLLAGTADVYIAAWTA